VLGTRASRAGTLTGCDPGRGSAAPLVYRGIAAGDAAMEVYVGVRRLVISVVVGSVPVLAPFGNVSASRSIAGSEGSVVTLLAEEASSSTAAPEPSPATSAAPESPATTAAPESPPTTTVAPAPAGCPTEHCGYAVIGDDGRVYGVIVCSNWCTGQRMQDGYMGCPPGCRLVVQGQQTADGNVAGWHGPDVVYDEGKQSFSLPGGGEIRSGARMEDAVFPTVPSSATVDGGAAMAAPDGWVYRDVDSYVAAEHTVVLSSDEVVFNIPQLSDDDVDYEVRFVPAGGGDASVVATGSLDGGVAVDDGAVRMMGSSVARGSDRWQVAVKRSKVSPVAGRLVLLLRLGDRSVVEVSAPIADVRRYASCAALTRIYPSGVSSSPMRAERYQHTRMSRRVGRPMVAPRVYTLNRRLDTDRDGIVCERDR
jgi:hypothetical protein